jgi:hypothetical protein
MSLFNAKKMLHSLIKRFVNDCSIGTFLLFLGFLGGWFYRELWNLLK